MLQPTDKNRFFSCHVSGRRPVTPPLIVPSGQEAKTACVTPLTSIDGTELTNSGKDMPTQALPGL